MVTLVERWLELATLLLETRPRSSAMRRRAVSSSYYALFHAVAKICADEIAGELGRDSSEYEIVYRSLDHKALLLAFKGQLAAYPRLRAIGESFEQLKTERNAADYKPPRSDVVTISRAEELLAEAKGAVAQLADLSDADRQRLVVRLLVRDPKR